MPTWTFYRLADGAVLQRQFTGPAHALQANIPPGCGALPISFDDSAARRVVGDTVVPWQPPKPPATAARDWQWSEATRQWQPVPSLPALRARAAAWLRRLMQQREAVQSGRVRELLLALSAGGSATPEAAAALQRINDDIEALRSHLVAVPGADRAALLALLELRP